MTTAIRLQGPLTPLKAQTPVDGQMPVLVSIEIVEEVPRTLDFDYRITDASSAVYFNNGGKMIRHVVPVTSSQMNVPHMLDLTCGFGLQSQRQVEVVLTISGNGQPLAPATGCRFAIESFSCAPAIGDVAGANALVEAYLALPFGGALDRSSTGGVATVRAITDVLTASANMARDVDNTTARRSTSKTKNAAATKAKRGKKGGATRDTTGGDAARGKSNASAKRPSRRGKG